MADFQLISASNLIALCAFIASGLSAYYAWSANRMASKQFRETVDRERDALIGANYLQLETASSDIFRYTAEHADLIDPIRGDIAPREWEGPADAKARQVLLNLYFQSLNLFEVCARFRRQDQIRPEVFASWMAWFVELLEDRYFRALWTPEIRSNYTRDVRDIFDIGVEIYDNAALADAKERAFYAAVAEVMTCPILATWPADVAKVRTWKELKSSKAFLSAGTNPPK